MRSSYELDGLGTSAIGLLKMQRNQCNTSTALSSACLRYPWSWPNRFVFRCFRCLGMTPSSNDTAQFTDPSLRPRKKRFLQTTDNAAKEPEVKPLPAAAKTENTKKRKRGNVDESDPKLQEFLETMRPTLRRRKGTDPETEAVEEEEPMVLAGDASDEEYETIPRRSATISQLAKQKPGPAADQQPSTTAPEPQDIHESPEMADPAEEEPETNVTDDEWLRSRTSRLLDIIDLDEETESAAQVATTPTLAATQEPDDQVEKTVDGSAQGPARRDDTDESMIRETCRLFVRNLSYLTSEEELREYFETFGALEEVRRNFFYFAVHPLAS